MVNPYRSLLPATVGFDRLFSTFEELNEMLDKKKPTYPPYNIYQQGEDYFIELAVAGFKEDELSVELDNNVLYVSGAIKAQETAHIHYQGLAFRDFQHKYYLNENAVVGDVTLEYGILKIKLLHIPPKGKEPKKFVINPQRLVEPGVAIPNKNYGTVECETKVSM